MTLNAPDSLISLTDMKCPYIKRIEILNFAFCYLLLINEQFITDLHIMHCTTTQISTKLLSLTKPLK